MNLSNPTNFFERYIAIDAHKHYVMVGGLNANREIVLPVRKIAVGDYAKWAQTNLKPGDTVVIEATTNTWNLYDATASLVGKVVVAHPFEVKPIANSKVKTDKLAVYHLARLLVANLIPEVWVPPTHVRELRTLTAHRRRLVKLRTMTYNRLHSLVHRNNLAPPEGGFFAEKNRSWWQALPLSQVEKLRARQDLALLDHLEPQIAEVDAELAQLSSMPPWEQYTPYLMQLPGFALVSVMTVLAAIGDISRFPKAKQLVSYAGLGCGVHDSGQTHRSGHITKQGRKELRWVLVQAAWSAVGSHPYWKQQFEQLTRRMIKAKAIVAIARKLLVVIWHVLTERAADRRADPDMVAFKLLTWSWKLTALQRDGLTSAQFVRYCLMQLKMGEDLTHIERAGHRRIASREEVLAIRPELSAAD